jgi:hypothetical protein
VAARVAGKNYDEKIHLPCWQESYEFTQNLLKMDEFVHPKVYEFMHLDVKSMNS